MSNPLQIVYRDKSIVVVNKPSLLLSVPGRAEDNKDSVASRVQQTYPDATVVHRLDWETSGLMVMAKNKEAHRHLSRQFETRVVQKEYRAVVSGEIASQGEASWPLICDWENRPRQKVCYEHGRPAQTFWQRLQYDANSNCSLVALKPITGRSHQLRVHMLQSGHAMLGDTLYASEPVVAQAPRLLLHAYSLSFYHPYHEAWLQFVLPCDLMALVNTSQT